MLAGLLVTVVLVFALWARRANVLEQAAATAWRSPRSRWTLLAGGVLSAATTAPIWRLAPFLPGRPQPYWADESTHAVVAAEIVEHGLPHGWIDGYFAGFPVAHHYPMGGWLVLSGLIEAGLAPATAAGVLGWLAVAAVPIVVYVTAVTAGARPAAALAGAAFIAWISPYNAFIGGFDVYFSLGVISQLLGFPTAILLVWAVAASRRPWAAPVAAAFTAAFHPQLAVAVAVLLAVALVASAERDAALRGLRAGLALVIAAAALYGQGVGSLTVPFGWPPGMGWRHVGFPPSRLAWWFLDGDLFDQERAPVLTAIAAAAAVAVLLRPRRPAARAAAAAAAFAIPFSVCGTTLAALGPLGEALLSVIQPLRFASLLPLVGASLVVIAAEESGAVVAALSPFANARLTPLWGSLPAGLALITALFGLPARFTWANQRIAHVELLRSLPCGKRTPPSYDAAAVKAALGRLAGGRLWYEGRLRNPVIDCVLAEGLDGASSVPVAFTGGVGAHVGVIWTAMSVLHPERDGSDRRAEALGIRFLLLLESDPIAEGWSLRQAMGPMRLYEHFLPTSRVGVGCVTEVWSGRDGELRKHLQDALATPEGATRLLDPHRLVEIASGTGPFVAATAPQEGCSSRGARVKERPQEPGRIEATLELPDPADVVVRATAFPAWRLFIDGVSTPYRMVAPGFFAARVPAGRHELVAQVSLLPGYFLVLLLGALGVTACALPASLLTALVRPLSGTRSRRPRPRSARPPRPGAVA